MRIDFCPFAAIFLMIASSAWQMIFTSAQDNVPASRNPFISIVPLASTPQFVLLTFDDQITKSSMNAFRPLTLVRNKYGCGIRATFFVANRNETVCELVQALLQGGHEIATSTYADVPNPTPQDIQEGISSMVSQCQVPIQQLRGFRTPFLEFNQSTINTLKQLGVLYDSSIEIADEVDSAYGRSHLWPFTFDGVGYQNVSRRLDPTVTNPGLWEVPITRLYDENNTIQSPMDFQPNDVYSVLKTNLERRYNGNRSPLLLANHGGWLSRNVFQVKTWIEDTNKAYGDVFFITVYELIEWMRAPKTADEFVRVCTDQTSECYTPLPLDCVHGTFDTTQCKCICDAPFCADASGVCAETVGCNDIDGNWSDWDKTFPCCDEQRLLTRTCTNPQPSGNGKDCEGVATMIEDCFPEDCLLGGWSEWSDWNDCCDATRERTRECQAPPTINGGRGCIGDKSETEQCTPDVCTKKYYPDFSLSICVLRGEPLEGGDPNIIYNKVEDCCKGSFKWAADDCITKSENPPVNGAWSPWSQEGPCCNGKKIRKRTCTEPAPANGGADCDGDDTIEEECTSDAVCENDGWGDWSDWGVCCAGQQNRTRTCLVTSIQCPGNPTETQSCAPDVCVSSFSPIFGPNKCVLVIEGQPAANDVRTDLSYTTAQECCQENFNWAMNICLKDAVKPIDGGWSEWSPYGRCCDKRMTRYRTCNNPAPQNNGKKCEGLGSETTTCDDDMCAETVSSSTKRLHHYHHHYGGPMVGFQVMGIILTALAMFLL